MKIKLRKLSFLAFFAIFSLSCASFAPRSEVAVTAHISGPQERVVTKSGKLELKAEDLNKTKEEVENLVFNTEGWVESWALSEDKYLNMTLRIPEASLENTMDSISELGKVTHRSLKSRDVTEQLIDLEARLKNLLALRERLRSYLDQATNLEEILNVEKELARVQTEIETIEGKLKILRNQIAMAQLDFSARRKRF